MKNIGTAIAGSHLTYVEMNAVNARAIEKPQSQYSATVPSLGAGQSWNSGPIAFNQFSPRSGVAIGSLATANLVVHADAKDMVKESNERDNGYDANQ